jgi:ribonuclease HI
MVKRRIWLNEPKMQFGIRQHIINEESIERIAIISDSNLIDTLKYRLKGQCSNNGAEQLAILIALENLQHLETNERTVLVLIRSRIALESLKNRKKHTKKKKKIRKKVTELERNNWKIKFQLD